MGYRMLDDFIYCSAGWIMYNVHLFLTIRQAPVNPLLAKTTATASSVLSTLHTLSSIPIKTTMSDEVPLPYSSKCALSERSREHRLYSLPQGMALRAGAVPVLASTIMERFMQLFGREVRIVIAVCMLLCAALKPMR
jgi:hypothetical protein